MVSILRFGGRTLVVASVGACAALGCGGRSDRASSEQAIGSGASGGAAAAGGAGTGPALSELADECQSIHVDNDEALAAAKDCDPTATNPCTTLIDSGGVCGCAVFVNAANADAIARVASTAADFQSLGCQSFYGECGVCARAASGRCNASGACETVFDDGQTSSDSPACTEAVAANAQAYLDASVCDPNGAVDQCSYYVSQGPACPCGAFVNPANDDAMNLLFSSEQQHESAGCRLEGACDACRDSVRAQCGADGHCVQVPRGNGRSCKVDGVVYADGEGNIPSPVDVCNLCGCGDGKLGCTELGCDDKPCPAGQTYGKACAECGVDGNCRLPEYGCFWPCSVGCGARDLVCMNDLCVAEDCRPD